MESAFPGRLTIGHYLNEVLFVWAGPEADTHVRRGDQITPEMQKQFIGEKLSLGRRLSMDGMLEAGARIRSPEWIKGFN